MAEGDAVTRYWKEKLKPQTRLSYCLISLTEKALLEAMCCYSAEGDAVDKSIDVLARRAGVTRKSAQRLLNGYKVYAKDKTTVIREIKGLKARGLVSELAPFVTKAGRTKPAVLRINWDALILDPSKLHILENRMQQTLKGMNSPSVPEEEPRPSGKTASEPSGNVVEFPGPPGHNVQTAWTQCPPPPGHSVHPRPDTVSRQDLGSDFGSSGNFSVKTSADAERGDVQIPVASTEKAVFKRPALDFSNPKNQKPKTWAELHPGLKAKVKRELELIAEAQLGLNMCYWTPEAIAKHSAGNMRKACERARIWTHVTEDLVKEAYERELADRKGRTDA